MRLKLLWYPIILLTLAGCGGDDFKLEKGPFVYVNREALEFNEEFYGGTYVGASSFDSLYVENRGDEPLDISRVVKTAPNDFIITLPQALAEGQPLQLKSREKAYIQVQFKPSAVKAYTGKLTIESNARNAAAKDIQLSGNGVQPPP